MANAGYKYINITEGIKNKHGMVSGYFRILEGHQRDTSLPVLFRGRLLSPQSTWKSRLGGSCPHLVPIILPSGPLKKYITVLPN